jgi:phosphate transport system protein
VEGHLLRGAFSADLEQLRLQVELMGLRVDQNLERAREVLVSGSEQTALAALAADDEIDAMNVSLTERCYEVLAREAPVASDLRLVVSVLRVLAELERVGDLALRVVKRRGDQAMMAAHPLTFDILLTLADQAIERYRDALRAWGTMDLVLASTTLASRDSLEPTMSRLLREVRATDGADAVPAALATFSVGRSVERISDHATVVSARVRYLVTGDPAHLVAEVR